ncbi:phage tail tape measure protein [Bacteroides uniformis]|uniref:phage tail tape measure protein n=2 Tax=Bacteroides TaxID=816 RepID=UPI000E4795B1|nr:phage tail tape measure protein [Bacteroides uniformis]RHJ76407.1 phage tail tape measure protein [Bacteroides uniformis]RHM78442.1 phage tail tape measure protein [Bacteroides uniformis]
MAKLYFKVGSDWEEVVRLRNEIVKLKQELMSMDGTQSPAAFKALNVQLAASNQRLDELVTNAAKAGAEMETGFKKGIYDGEKAVNSLSEEIIKQKDIIRETQNDVSMLTEQYKKLGKYDPKRQSLSDELNRAKAALGEQKYALGELQSQQALARLSTKALKDEYALFKDESKAVITTNDEVGVSFKKMLATIGGIAMLKQVASNVVSTAGMFQKYESVLTNALDGSSDKAKAYLSDINSFAAKTNFQLDELTDDFIKFVNRGVTPSMDAMKKMGDFTNTVAKPFDQLTEAILDINNPERWKEFGVRVQTEGNKVKLSFRDMTVECDRTVESVMKAVEQFGSMKGVEGSTEAIAKTIEGQMSNFEDTITTALAEIGLANQDLISGSISVADTVVKNYEVIGQSVLALVSIYGVYRTGLLVNSIVEQGFTKAIWGKVAATKAATVAQATYNKVLAMNPYVLAGTAIVSLGIAMWTLADNTSIAEKAQERFNKKQEESAKQEKERKQKIEGLIQSSRDIALADLQRGQSLAELRKEYPKIFSQYDIESIKLADILELKRQIAEEDSKRAGERVAKDFEAANKAVSDYENTLSAKQINGGKLTQQEISKLKELRFYRDEFLVERGKGISEQFISSLKDVDISKFDEYISELEKRIKGKDGNGKVKMKLPIDVEGSLSDEAIYEVKDIKNLIDTAKSTKQTRIETEKNKTTYQQDLAAAKADWEKAKKGYEVLLKDQQATSEQVKKAREDMLSKEKAYKDLGGITGSSLTKQDNQTEKLRKQTDKYDALLDKQSLEQQRSAEDLQMEVDEARIKAMDEGSAKTIAEMELNFEKEMQAIDRQKEDALRKKVEDARAAWEANPKNKGKSFNATDIKLSDDEQNYYDELYKTAIISNEKIYKNLAERYLSYADERLAIEKKFNDDISILQEARKKAETKGDASEIAQIDRSIEKRTEIKNEDIFKLDAEQFKKNMNWEQVFGNLDKVSTDTLKKLKANLKDFISSQKDLSPESLKELVDAIERIDDKVSERDSFETMSISFKSLKEVTDAQREAQKAYNKALEEGTDEEKKNAKATLESAKNSKQKALYEATDALHKGINEIGQYVDAGNQVIGIMETLGIKTPEWMEGTMSGFGEMLNGLGNIDLMKPMSIITGSLQTVKGALTSVISLGGLIPGLDGADYSHYNEMVEEYNKLNEIWDELIDKKLEYINTSYGAEADKVGKEALELVNKSIEAYRILGRERLNSGASAGSHSIGKRMAKNTSSSDWQDIADALDMSVKDAKDFIGTGRMTGLFDLTTEQLEKLKSEAPTFWAKLDGDVRDYLDKIIEGEERIEEIHNQINEQLTQTTFDGVYSNFIDTLMDMKASSKDAAEDVSEYFMQAMLSEQIGTLYQDKLKKWYEKFAKGMEDGSLTESERNALNSEYMGYIEEAMKLRDELAAATGYDKISQESTSQPSTSRGFGTEMTHEDAGELSGRFTALQIAGEEIKNQSTIQSQSLNLLTVKADALLSINTETRNIADDTRNLIAQSYLELVQISENTGAIVKPIQQMQRDIAEVKKNTAKL